MQPNCPTSVDKSSEAWEWGRKNILAKLVMELHLEGRENSVPQMWYAEQVGFKVDLRGTWNGFYVS